MKLAMYSLYGNATSGTVWEADSWREKDKDYTRITEIIEVEFKPRDAGEVVVEQVKCINSMIKKIHVAAEAEVTTLEERRDKLLAIEHQPQG